MKVNYLILSSLNATKRGEEKLQLKGAKWMLPSQKKTTKQNIKTQRYLETKLIWLSKTEQKNKASRSSYTTIVVKT